MSTSEGKQHTQENASVNDLQDRDFDRLRELLLGSDFEEIKSLVRRLMDKSAYIDSVAKVISEAIEIRSKQDDSLTSALMSNVEKAIKISVRKDSRPLIEAIFPIIGPAIRKSIAETINSMLKNINDVVEHSLSIRSLKWRIEARRTGKSYAEVALLRSLAFQVEQVFLIHKETGLLLEHQTSQQAVVSDPDMVSGMLTAIQDFIADSFNVNDAAGLHSMRIGELTVLIEQGPRAILAAVVMGNAPADMELTIQETIEKVHASYADELKDYEGDNDTLRGVDYYLQECLRSQTKQEISDEKKQLGWFTWFLLILLVGSIGYWSYNSYTVNKQWQHVTDTFELEAGYIIIDKSKSNGDYLLTGLRDPLSRSPEQVIDLNDFSDTTVNWQWKTYLSMEEAFVTTRIKQHLGETSDIEIIYQDGLLTLVGNAEQAWIDRAKLSVFIPGVDKVDTTQLTSSESQQLAYERAFMATRDKLESIIIYFESSEAAVSAEERSKLAQIAEHVKQLLIDAQNSNYVVKIHINGQADNIGNQEQNEILSRARANAVLNELSNLGIDDSLFVTNGVGSKASLDGSSIDTTKLSQQRRVTLRVVLVEQSK